MQHLTPHSALQNGKYRIIEVLGQGSFGITYRAHHEFLDRTVAIKEFFMKELNSRSEDGSITGLSDGSLSYNYAQKFRKEAQNLARLQHPNIVSVTDCFDENGTFYYVMDYIDGQNLNEYIKSRALSQDEAVAIIKEVAKALQYMHEDKHMLHLDLKPGNIMRRSSDGHIFLIDFGLSKHYNTNGEPETSTTIGLGTAGYAPVEQGNQAKSGEFRPTIDVYALGATLFKLLTGETPPAASELISDDELIATRLKAHSVSEALVSAVVNAMLPNVKKRTQTIDAFVESLSSKEDVKTSNETAKGRRNNSKTNTEDTLYIKETNPKEDENALKKRAETLKGQFEFNGWVIRLLIFVIYVYIAVLIAQNDPKIGFWVVILGIPCVFCIFLLINSIGERIENRRRTKWINQHPNDPVCKYLK